MKNYMNEEIKFEGCPGCAYARGEFSLPCGMAYEDDDFTLSQDWELPIEGFFVVSPKKCIDSFNGLTGEEQIKIMSLVNETINILKDNNVCDKFNVVFEEKENRHFHIWIMPRHKWMKDLAGNITKNINQIFEYAKDNFRTVQTYDRIQEITNIVKDNLKLYDVSLTRKK